MLEKMRNDKLVEQSVQAMRIIEQGMPAAAQRLFELATGAASETVQEKPTWTCSTWAG